MGVCACAPTSPPDFAAPWFLPLYARDYRRRSLRFVRGLRDDTYIDSFFLAHKTANTIKDPISEHTDQVTFFLSATTDELDRECMVDRERGVVGDDGIFAKCSSVPVVCVVMVGEWRHPWRQISDDKHTTKRTAVRHLN